MLKWIYADKKDKDQLKICQNAKSHIEEQQHNQILMKLAGIFLGIS